MRLSRSTVLLISVAAFACEPEPCPPDLDAAVASPRAPLALEEPVAWTAIGSSATCEESACRATCEAQALRISGPLVRRDGGVEVADAHPPVPYVACVNETADRTAGTCFCGTDREHSTSYAKRSGPCLLRGRNDACLYTAAEFPGCLASGRVGDDVTRDCRPICEDIANRKAAEDERMHPASVHGSFCQGVPSGGSSCQCVLQVDDACYASFRAPYSCTHSPQAIFEMDQARRAREERLAEQGACR